MGDDFNWLAVSHDVQLFARTHNLTFSSFDRCHERLRDAPSAETVCHTLRRDQEDEGTPQRFLFENAFSLSLRDVGTKLLRGSHVSARSIESGCAHGCVH